jgi:acetyl-CoA acetyltransferase
VINLTMLVVAASLFHATGNTEIDTIEGAHAGLERLIGGGAALAFAVALLASGLSSSSVGTYAGQVVMQGFIDRRIPLFLRRLVTMAPALVVLAIGVDTPEPWRVAPAQAGIGSLEGGLVAPFTHFALLASRYQRVYGVTDVQLARVAEKNHRNGAANPFAQRQQVRTLEEILERPISGPFTRLQCCPVGEGAAAVIVMSDEAIERFGLDAARCPRFRASVQRSQGFVEPGGNADTVLTADTAQRTFEQAGIGPADVDVVEMHDAFTIEELLYLEAMGFCGPGESAPLLDSGAWDVGGRCAVSPSGGLLAMGHPLGPTGTGQIVEVTRQLRGEAGVRQQPGARHGLAHMVGIGAVCVMHVLEREEP